MSKKTGVLTTLDADGTEIEMYPEVITDTTLSVSGKPADAAAVGEALATTNSNLPLPLTQEQYDALSEEEKKNGRLYIIVEETV